MNSFLLSIYEAWFQVINKGRKNHDLPDSFIHLHLVAVITTGLLMWAYAFLAIFTISSPVPGIVGVIASIVHLFSPFLFWRSNNYLLNTSVYIGAGIIHQMTFAYYTGGFDSNILIWLGILPMLAGVTAGRKGAILWASITTISVCFYMSLQINGYSFPDLISPIGHGIAQGLILFGWIFISTVVIWMHVYLDERNASKLEASRQRIQNLVNILSHDISTPVTVIGGKLNQLLRSHLNDEQLAAAAKAYKAAERLNQITESVRELRLTELSKKELTITVIDIRELVIELKDIFSEKLEQKELKLNWSVSSDVYDFSSSRSLLLNQILGNLLSNAIKYSTPGSEIRLRVSRVNGHVQFLIEDSGLGIPKDMRESIFQADASRSSIGTLGEVGTGFGLPIVKGCVDRLGGKIIFETKTKNEGVSGTCFKLLFPHEDGHSLLS